MYQGNVWILYLKSPSTSYIKTFRQNTDCSWLFNSYGAPFIQLIGFDWNSDDLTERVMLGILEFSF